MQHRDTMHPPRVDLAYTESIATCPAIEHHEECLRNPRWIEEDWSLERVEYLQRAQDDFENDSEWFSRDQRVNMSRSIIYGRVYLEHAQHTERLHTLQMIRGDARGDIIDPSCLKARNSLARTAAIRRARKRYVRAARSLTPEQGRAGHKPLTDSIGGTPSCTIGIFRQTTRTRTQY
jgi:hypothetical protein